MSLEQAIVEARAVARASGRCFDHRYLVNWLRHRHTDYEAQFSSARALAAANRAIAERYPELREECERQICARVSAQTRQVSDRWNRWVMKDRLTRVTV